MYIMYVRTLIQETLIASCCLLASFEGFQGIRFPQGISSLKVSFIPGTFNGKLKHIYKSKACLTFT